MNKTSDFSMIELENIFLFTIKLAKDYIRRIIELKG